MRYMLSEKFTPSLISKDSGMDFQYQSYSKAAYIKWYLLGHTPPFLPYNNI